MSSILLNILYACLIFISFSLIVVLFLMILIFIRDLIKELL